MSNAMKVVPSENDVSTGVRETQGIAEGLADVLADTYRLVFKSHAYHWNVEGPLFYSVHNLTEEHYKNMFDAADELAERIRALGYFNQSSIVPRQGTSEDRVILDVDVVEQPTGSLSFGASYSAENGAGAAISFFRSKL